MQRLHCFGALRTACSLDEAFLRHFGLRLSLSCRAAAPCFLCDANTHSSNAPTSRTFSALHPCACPSHLCDWLFRVAPATGALARLICLPLGHRGTQTKWKGKVWWLGSLPVKETSPRVGRIVPETSLPVPESSPPPLIVSHLVPKASPPASAARPPPRPQIVSHTPTLDTPRPPVFCILCNVFCVLYNVYCILCTALRILYCILSILRSLYNLYVLYIGYCILCNVH